MERKIVRTPERVEYTFTMKEFKDKLGITDENSVLTASVSFPGKVKVLMSWTG